jgi:hypothetical protein
VVVNLQGFKNLEGLICNSRKFLTAIVASAESRKKLQIKKGQSVKPRPFNFYI